MQSKFVDGLISFIDRSVSPYHSVAEMSERLKTAGFTELRENDVWDLTRGKAYFVTRGSSAIIAFKIPETEFSGCQIVASHCDSPSLKLKTNFTVNSKDVYTKLSVEKYGGAILSTWFDRPLAVSGRIMVKDGNKTKQVLVDSERNVVLIPNMPPHLDRNTVDSAKYDMKTDLMPLFAQGKDKDLLKLIAETANVEVENIVSHELFLYNAVKGSFFGSENEFLAAPRIDNLACVYASLQAIIDSKNSKNMAVHCVFNNEEIGSATREGAGSDFLLRVITRVLSVLGYDNEKINTTLASSILLSADNAHALHPNHTEMFDAENYPVLNAGVVIKESSGKKYMTDVISHALVKQLCEDNKISYQVYHNRSDIPGGSTLGCIAIDNFSVKMADIGLAQLAMHSTLETTGTTDIDHMVALLEKFYSATILISDDEFEIEF